MSAKVEIDSTKYLINFEEKTAQILKSKHIGSIIIPRSINFDSQEYVITSLLERSFSCKVHMHSFDFAVDSEVRTIERNAFEYNNIQSITIPSSLVELKKGWCN